MVYGFYDLWSVEKSLNTRAAPRKKTSSHGPWNMDEAKLLDTQYTSPDTIALIQCLELIVGSAVSDSDSE